MGLIQIARPWDRQPQIETPIDSQHPLTRGLVHVHSGAAFLSRWVRVNDPVLTPRATSGGGLAWRFTSASSQYFKTTALAVRYPLTMFAYVRQSATGANRSILGVGGPLNNRHILYIAAADKIAAFSGDSGGGTGQAVSGGTYTSTTAYYAFGARFSSTTSRDVWANGVSVGVDGSTSAPGTLDTATLGVHWANGGPVAGFYWSGDIAFAAIWTRSLANSEMVELYQRARDGALWELFEPLRTPIFYGSAASTLPTLSNARVTGITATGATPLVDYSYA